MIRRLPDNCSMLYADLLQKASAFVALSGGTFTAKTINGSRYWYYQTRTLAGHAQKYLGKESAALLAQIERAKSARTEVKLILAERWRRVAILLVSGATPGINTPPRPGY